MADKYELLEDAIVARVQAQVTGLQSVVSMAASGVVGEFPRPRVEVLWAKTETRDVGSVAGRIRVTDEVFFTVLIFAADAGGVQGGARRGAGGAYDLRGQVRKALLGFEPSISNTEAVFPMAPVVGSSEDVFQIETGLYGLATQWSIQLNSYEGQG